MEHSQLLAFCAKPLIKQAIDKNHIFIDNNTLRITYRCINPISRNLNNPEEEIQAEAFCALIFDYQYSPN